jgi:hypothetical protein
MKPKEYLLWYADSKVPLEQAIQRAADYFLTKYKQSPTVIYVHPGTFPINVDTVGGMTLWSSPSVLKNHFWLGLD